MNMTITRGLGSLGGFALVAVCLVDGAAIHARAQATAQRLAFEVASVKENKNGSQPGSVEFRPGGTFVATNTPAASLLYTAFQTDPPLQSKQYSGIPAWAQVTRYDITAKISSDAAQDVATLGARESVYVRSLLEDRFALDAHLELRDMPVYILTAPNGAGKLRRSVIDCTKPEDRGKCGVSFGAGRLASPHMELSNLVGILANATGRPVLNQTGIDGAFDIDLHYAAAQPLLDATDQPPPSIFTVVQEQLGLKLESIHAS